MLIDTHCHLDFTVFDEDREEIINRAAKLSVNDIIVPSVSQESWQKTITVCAQYKQLHLALGLHPVFIDQHQPQHLTDLDKLINIHTPIAVGEIGLDFYLKELDRNKQIAFFTKQLIIAKRHQLPVIIHNRKAHDECIKILIETGVSGGIIHAFNGSIQQAEKYIELGFLLGFGGMLTYQRSTKLRRLLDNIPLEYVVLETDAPDMTVSQHKGERNSPEYLPYILDVVAMIKGSTPSNVAKITSKNTRKLFVCGTF